MKKIFIKAIPFTLNELLWSTGVVLFFFFYSKLGKDIFVQEALNNANIICELFYVIFGACAAGVGIIVGNSLGASMFDEAKSNAKLMKGYALMLSILTAVIMWFSAPLLTNILGLSDDTLINSVTGVIRVSSIAMIVYCYNAVSFFILRAGGDSISAFLLDQLPTWLVGLPLAFLLGNYTALSIIPLYSLTHIGDIVKAVVAYLLVAKNKWVKNLTLVNKAFDAETS